MPRHHRPRCRLCFRGGNTALECGATLCLSSCFSCVDYSFSIDIPVLKIRPPGTRYAHQALFTIKLLYLQSILSPISFSFWIHTQDITFERSFHFGSFEALVLSSTDSSSKARHYFRAVSERHIPCTVAFCLTHPLPRVFLCGN